MPPWGFLEDRAEDGAEHPSVRPMLVARAAAAAAEAQREAGPKREDAGPAERERALPVVRAGAVQLDLAAFAPEQVERGPEVAGEAAGDVPFEDEQRLLLRVLRAERLVVGAEEGDRGQRLERRQMGIAHAVPDRVDDRRAEPHRPAVRADVDRALRAVFPEREEELAEQVDREARPVRGIVAGGKHRRPVHAHDEAELRIAEALDVAGHSARPHRPLDPAPRNDEKDERLPRADVERLDELEHA